jgi:hypothetical protein
MAAAASKLIEVSHIVHLNGNVAEGKDVAHNAYLLLMQLSMQGVWWNLKLR